MQVKQGLRSILAMTKPLSCLQRAFVSGYGNCDVNGSESHIPTVNDKL